MDIGEELETYTIEPLEEPVPQEGEPEPLEQPAEVEPTPAYVLRLLVLGDMNTYAPTSTDCGRCLISPRRGAGG